MQALGDIIILIILARSDLSWLMCLQGQKVAILLILLFTSNKKDKP